MGLYDFFVSFCPGLCLSKIPIVPLQRKTVSKYIPCWVVLGAMNSAKNAVVDGVQCSDVDKVARDVITSAGYGEYFTHSTGHSVGLLIHENPSLSPKCDKKLKSGNVVTVEPGIYIENEFGVRVEDMVVVTKNGTKTLTECKNSLIIL